MCRRTSIFRTTGVFKSWANMPFLGTCRSIADWPSKVIARRGSTCRAHKTRQWLALSWIRLAACMNDRKPKSLSHPRLSTVDSRSQILSYPSNVGSGLLYLLLSIHTPAATGRLGPKEVTLLSCLARPRICSPEMADYTGILHIFHTTFEKSSQSPLLLSHNDSLSREYYL